jgi:putative toxin-antitoxin system antitoxin component (TIGR02293 family)
MPTEKDMTDQSLIMEALRAEVIAAAVELFEGDPETAELWLNTPLRAIGYDTPYSYMDTSAKIQTLRDVIGRLEHGIWT